MNPFEIFGLTKLFVMRIRKGLDRKNQMLGRTKIDASVQTERNLESCSEKGFPADYEVSTPLTKIIRLLPPFGAAAPFHVNSAASSKYPYRFMWSTETNIRDGSRSLRREAYASPTASL